MYESRKKVRKKFGLSWGLVVLLQRRCKKVAYCGTKIRKSKIMILIQTKENTLQVGGFLNLSQAAQYLSLGERKVRELATSGAIRSYQPNTKFLFKREDLDAYVRRFPYKP